MPDQDDRSRAIWRKSRHSTNGGDCVEVARLRGHIGIRDSKDQHGEPLVLASAQWAALAEKIKQGSPDPLG
jgi:hypothetical protein